MTAQSPGLRHPRHLRFVLPILAAFLSACTYRGATVPVFGTDNPVARKFSWFSYLGGDNIRNGCGPGDAERYRFVYNAVYTEQVRSYDLVPAPEAGRFDLTVRVTGAANLSSLTTDLARPDLFAPWRPAVSTTRLRRVDVDSLVAALGQDGLLERPAGRLELPSIGFYWIVAACRRGQFRLNGILWPASQFDSGSFHKLLFSWDFTDVAVNPPRPTTEFQIYGTNDEEEYVNYFQVRLGPDGLN